jgi:hypothetical protein
MAEETHWLRLIKKGEKHMRFEAKSENELRRENLIPAGEYGFEVLTAEDKQSAKGNDMIALKLIVYMSDGSQRHVYDWILEAFAFKLRHFCEATGLIEDYNAGRLCAADCVGRSGKVKIGINEDKSGDYPPSNRVLDYIVAKGNAQPAAPAAVPKQAPRESAKQLDDDEKLPF